MSEHMETPLPGSGPSPAGKHLAKGETSPLISRALLFFQKGDNALSTPSLAKGQPNAKLSSRIIIPASLESEIRKQPIIPHEVLVS
jgi:hypothetical protein